jgi:WD40 repeat protein
LISAGDDGTVRRWRKWQAEMPGNETIFEQEGNEVRTAAFSAGGKLLVFAGADRIFRLRLNNDIKEVPSDHRGIVHSLALSPDNSMLASADHNGFVFLWKLQDGSAEPIADSRFSQTVYALAFSKTGDKLAAGGKDDFITVWDIRNNNFEVDTTLIGGGRVHSLVFSPGDSFLVSGGYDRKVYVWNLKRTTRPPIELPGHAGPVNSVAISPDGKLLASGSSDRTIRLWDLKDIDDPPIVLGPREGGILSLAFDPAGNTLASAGSDPGQRIFLWETRIKTLADRVCQKVKRSLTREEWETYVGKDIPYQSTCEELTAGE